MTGMPASRSVCLSVFVVVGLGICALVGSEVLICVTPAATQAHVVAFVFLDRYVRRPSAPRGVGSSVAS